tara:strand:- start:123 stop:320 length:198 start_codon:yes stop_codon:yes gene_type:complete
MDYTQEYVSVIIGGIIQDLEWLNEQPDGDWYDGHGDLKNKAFEVQRTVNKLREFAGFPTYNQPEK